MSIGQDLLNVPMGDMIRDMAFAIADSQFQLDQSGMRTAEMMGGLQSIFDDEGNQTFDDSRIFFGYEYMSVRAALAYAIFDDSLTGALDDDSIKLKEVVLDLVAELGNLNATEREALSDPESEREGFEVEGKPLLNEIIRVPTRLSMMELGFTPTFYQFVDTIIEVKIAIKMTRSFEHSRTRTDASRDRSSASNRSRRGGVSSACSAGGARAAMPASPRCRRRRSMRPILRNILTPPRARACCAPNWCRCRRRPSWKSGSAVSSRSRMRGAAPACRRLPAPMTTTPDRRIDPWPSDRIF